LARLLRHTPAQGYLVVRLAVENAPAEVVAAETGLDPAQLVTAAGAALSALALDYESVAFAGAVQEPGLGTAIHAAMRKERRARSLTRS
jgi:hypothetical protein